ncbi:hypothetical protein CWO92_08420 [Heyndrickxia camelliae]|uniref:Uncharacterized protein n=1 Tax=Heyndrickxia camelliae TaxID=1707093 RepID=A0A2N3LM61_9BACI|nr:hypothetical protein CWO92_08420 [Heyndrickxia camelliae]
MCVNCKRQSKTDLFKTDWAMTDCKIPLKKAICSKLSKTNTYVQILGEFQKLCTLSSKSDGKVRVKGIYYIQNVNDYHSSLKGWMDCFNGVAIYNLTLVTKLAAILIVAKFECQGETIIREGTP